jgi:hypothetical protein
VATLSAKHGAVAGACIHVRPLSIQVRMDRMPKTVRNAKPEK